MVQQCYSERQRVVTNMRILRFDNVSRKLTRVAFFDASVWASCLS